MRPELMQMLQQMMSGLGFGPPPDPETYRAIKAAQHNNTRVYKAWDMFMTLISNGDPATQAMRKVEEAISVWQEYEDRNWIEPPTPEPSKIATPAFPPFVIPGTRPEPARCLYILVDATGKVAESEPGVLMVFENSQAAFERAEKSNEYEVVTVAGSIIGPARVDAEFIEDPHA